MCQRSAPPQFDFRWQPVTGAVAVELFIEEKLPFKLASIATLPSWRRRLPDRERWMVEKSMVGEKNSPPVTAIGKVKHSRSVLPCRIAEACCAASARSPLATRISIVSTVLAHMPTSPGGMLCRTILRSVPSSS